MLRALGHDLPIAAIELGRIVLRYVEGLSQAAAWIPLSIAVYGLAFLALSGQLRGGQRWSLAGLVIAVACALHWGWIGDDAFISFRYVRNWVEGAGLVFNPGERVEGYTNFLWVVLLGPFQALGLSLPLVSVVLSTASFVLALLLTSRLARELWALARVAAPDARQLPIAALLLGVNYVFASFATSGLETMFASLLVLAAVERAERGSVLGSGTLGILATLAHPDHAIFYVCLAATFVWPERRWRELARFSLPFVLIYVPYFLWRWSYYGDFFPNTYYAKNAGQLYFSQGARYIAISGLSAGLWAALPLAAYGVVRWQRLRAARFCALAFPAFLLYIAKIGGDFMLGRLLCPLLPFVFVMAELGLRTAWAAGAAERRRAKLALALFCTAAVPVRFIAPREVYAQVADERTFYPIGSYVPFRLESAYWDWAHAFERLFQQLSRKPTLAMYSVGIVGYESRLRIVDNAGLNHRGVAHWRTPHRGRPGHEKIISPSMLLESGADFSDVPPYPDPYLSLGRADIAGVKFHTVSLHPTLFDELARAGVAVPPLLQHIDEYEPAATAERLACDLWFLEQVYFRHATEHGRRARLLGKVFAARPEWEAYQELLLQTASSRLTRWQPVAAIDFDHDAQGGTTTGEAFDHNPASAEGLGQHAIGGARGRFLNSFQERGGNEARGTYTSAPFEIRGEVITLRVGGGYFADDVYAELVVDGQRQAHATGCNSDILGQRLWPTATLMGREARLRVVDDRGGDFGHLVVDELVQWMPAHAARDHVLEAPVTTRGAP